MDIKLADFDDVEYHIVITDKDVNLIQMSMKMKCLAEIMPMGTKAALESTFPGMLQGKADVGYDMTLYINAEKSKGDKTLITNLSQLRKICMAAPLERCLEALAKNQAGNLKPMLIKYRPKESIFIQPTADRVFVYFSMDFFDDTDRTIATLFMQEFDSAQKKNQSAPSAVFSKDPPAQLKSFPGFKEDPSCIGYMTFAFFPIHADKAEKIKIAANLLVGFRSYIHYHVKSAKTYLQSRMRMRSELLLKVLNRANPDAAEAEKATGRRNTAAGTVMKTFRKF